VGKVHEINVIIENAKSEILPKARKSTKELRAFYKKMGVKK